MGGIATYEDAIEMMLAGATAVSVGTANFRNPSVTMEIVDGIERYLIENKIDDIRELIGGVKE
ncbi:MAG: dihydroorotate dehydrogenase, partial [Lachnospiraceae bacterium]|nr:dihydroorotate dehydrogenase [Lachnospiraceae bacterium]